MNSCSPANTHKVLNPPGQPLAITQGGPAGGRSSPPASGQFAVQPPPIQTSHPQPPGSAPGSSVDSPVGSPGTTGPIAAAMNAGQLSRPSSQQQQHAAPQQHNRNISTASMLSHATPSSPGPAPARAGSRGPPPRRARRSSARWRSSRPRRPRRVPRRTSATRGAITR